MSLPATRYWQELTSPDFAGLDPERTVAVLPVGAIEQHGPHLPVMVDACLADALVRRTLEILPADLPVLVLPTCAYGKSNEHLRYPGTLTLSAATLQALWTEIGASVARAGVRKLLLLNSHGGQIATCSIVARELRIAHGMFAVSVIWPQLGLPPGLFDATETRFGIHAGEIETAMMLAVRPDLVRQGLASDFVPLTRKMEPDYPILASLGAAGFGWQAQDLHAEGAAGNATRATPEKGRAVIDHIAHRLAALLDEMSRFPLASFDAEPA